MISSKTATESVTRVFTRSETPQAGGAGQAGAPPTVVRQMTVTEKASQAAFSQASAQAHAQLSNWGYMAHFSAGGPNSLGALNTNLTNYLKTTKLWTPTVSTSA